MYYPPLPKELTPQAFKNTVAVFQAVNFQNINQAAKFFELSPTSLYQYLTDQKQLAPPKKVADFFGFDVYKDVRLEPKPAREPYPEDQGFPPQCMITVDNYEEWRDRGMDVSFFNEPIKTGKYVL